MNQQTHLIFGTGLIGGYVGGVFLSQGLDTTFLGRPKSQNAMCNGLTVSNYLGHSANVDAPSFHSGDGQYDVIWVAVKCTAMTSIVDELGSLLKPSSTIVCCQNGLGSDQVIRDNFPNHQVLNAIAVFNVAQVSDDHLSKSTEGDFIIEDSESTRECFDQFSCDLLPSRLSLELNAEKWAKLQLNLANSVNALSDIPILDMLHTRGFRRIIAGMMNELLAVTDAKNIELPKMAAIPGKLLPLTMNVPNWLYKIMAKKVIAIDPKARMSMWWDLSGGRQTEIEYLNAAVVRAGKELGIDCPINQRIVELVKSVERGENKIGFSADALSAEVYR
ncbi:MAG: 2-dehydropantoate 2-reductase [Cryomorphaceae bacterium]|jgi:2-dehydropantoate 2-reductase